MDKDHTDEIFAKLERTVPGRAGAPTYPDDYDTTVEPTPEELEAAAAAAQEADEEYRRYRMEWALLGPSWANFLSNQRNRR